MKNLILKELQLSMHPTCVIFLSLSAMLLIPNYPYHVVFFYTGLAVFFTCLTGRENQDIFYTLLLPVQKKDAVKGRFGLVVLLELAQLVVAIPFAVLRRFIPVGPNLVGMDANIALFGSALFMLGLFNFVFFGIYYAAPQKVGKAFVLGSTVVFVYIAAAEALVHLWPFAMRLDTPDPINLLPKLLVLAGGAALYCVFTAAAYKRAQTAFEELDL